MARNRYTDEDTLTLPREIEVNLAVAGGDATQSNLRKRFGGTGRLQLSQLKPPEWISVI